MSHKDKPKALPYEPSKGVPYVPPELVAYLEYCFPDRLPSQLLGLPEVARRVGQQDVIRVLRLHLDSQLSKQMEDT